jgi:hypothetical protein
MMKLVSFLSLLPFAASTSFQYQNDLNCGSALTNIDLQVNCEGGNITVNKEDIYANTNDYCFLHDDVTFEGMVTVSATLPKSICAEVNMCLMGIQSSYTCRKYYPSISTCSDIRWTPAGTNVTYCPSPGLYGFKGSATLPFSDDETDGWLNLWGFGKL